MKEQSFFNKFAEDERKKLLDFFEELNKNINLTKKETKLFNDDFKNAILYYYSKNKKIDEILQILSLDNLGNCYKNKATEWYPLDNSAKIYPLAMKENWMSVYRMSYYLNDEIIPEILQIALTFTMKRFPTFRTSIRKGFFWHYIDAIKKRFAIEEEQFLPCSNINVSKLGKQSFKVLYYQNRISVEIFHVLTDGYGGIVFLSTLVSEYLKLIGKEIGFNELVLNVNENVSREEIEDEFLTKHLTSKTTGLIDSKALMLDGKLSNIRPCQLIHFDLDAIKLKELAHNYKITVNELMLSYLFLVLSYSTSKDGYIKIQVPVNMRKYYKSRTLRNFALYNNISIKKSEITSLEEVIKKVKNQSQEKLSKNKLNEVMLYSNKLVKSLRFIPLFIKRPIANFIYGYIGDKSQTTVLSNLGNIDLPVEILKHIKSADFILGTTISNKALFSLVTINNIATLSMSKFTTNAAVENGLYNIFKENDLLIRIHGSEIYENRK